MGYKLAMLNKSKGVTIGKDLGFKDSFHYERRFNIQKYKGKILLVETKSSKGYADFSRVFEIVGDKPSIMDYINEDGENAGQNWTH